MRVWSNHKYTFARTWKVQRCDAVTVDRVHGGSLHGIDIHNMQIKGSTHRDARNLSGIFAIQIKFGFYLPFSDIFSINQDSD